MYMYACNVIIQRGVCYVLTSSLFTDKSHKVIAVGLIVLVESDSYEVAKITVLLRLDGVGTVVRFGEDKYLIMFTKM